MPSAAVNLGPREQRKRRLMGIVALTVGVGAAFVLVVYGAPRLLRLVIFLPLWIAGLGLLQAREKTCIALAARGTCNMDAGEQPIEDEEQVAQLRATARRIHHRALITAVIITLVTLAFPVNSTH
ncbi:MAG: hypothetical protein QOF02_3607 [Blastocatellia bacterium]|jgi:hypothetical protein|nr:hypothetical protein [Blastocatellia bacterium]